MSKMPDYLMGGRLIVKPIQKQEEQIDSIVIPRTANADLATGVVVMVDGAVKYLDATDGVIKSVDVGHIVLYGAEEGVGQFINGVPHLWLEARQIWAGFKSGEEWATL